MVEYTSLDSSFTKKRSLTVSCRLRIFFGLKISRTPCIRQRKRCESKRKQSTREEVWHINHFFQFYVSGSIYSSNCTGGKACFPQRGVENGLIKIGKSRFLGNSHLMRSSHTHIEHLDYVHVSPSIRSFQSLPWPVSLYHSPWPGEATILGFAKCSNTLGLRNKPFHVAVHACMSSLSGLNWGTVYLSKS